jgi:hypothetical protein
MSSILRCPFELVVFTKGREIHRTSTADSYSMPGGGDAIVLVAPFAPIMGVT